MYTYIFYTHYYEIHIVYSYARFVSVWSILSIAYTDTLSYVW